MANQKSLGHRNKTLLRFPAKTPCINIAFCLDFKLIMHIKRGITDISSSEFSMSPTGSRLYGVMHRLEGFWNLKHKLFNIDQGHLLDSVQFLFHRLSPVP